MEQNERNEIRYKVNAAIKSKQGDFEVAGIDFQIRCYDDSKGSKSIYLWTNHGCRSLFRVSNILGDPRQYDESITSIIVNYVNGFMYCAECGKVMSLDEIGGSYFAGYYCKHCWETKWRDIEAKETYN